MTFAQSIRTCLTKYATFQGRASRSEYWWFVLFFSVVFGGLIGAGFALGFPQAREIGTFGGTALTLLGLGGLFFLAMLLPLWAVAVRRFHDRDLSGWAYLGLVLLGMVPWVGTLASIATIVITALPSKPGGNRFGLDPRLPVADVF